LAEILRKFTSKGPERAWQGDNTLNRYELYLFKHAIGGVPPTASEGKNALQFQTLVRKIFGVLLLFQMRSREFFLFRPIT
jgi:hypothetical protein